MTGERRVVVLVSRSLTRGAATTVPALQTLSCAVASETAELTLAWLRIGPGAIGRVVMRARHGLSHGDRAMVHLTTRSDSEHVPPGTVAETNSRLLGNVSVITTFVATAGPELVTASA